MQDEEATLDRADESRHLEIWDWLWRPSHAKLWWGAIALYWGGMIGAVHIKELGDIYHSAFVGFANVLFFPPLVILILLFGYFGACIGQLDFAGGAAAEEFFEQQRDWYGPSGMLKEFDPLDPASGSLWIGNPLNPLNGANINRHPS
jgi:hypothetical protein